MTKKKGGASKEEDTKQGLTATVFSTIMKLLQWDDALNQLTTQSQKKGNKSLLSYFQPVS